MADPQLPTADELFGKAGQLPTADEFFNRPQIGTLDAPGVGYVGEVPQSSEEMDQYVHQSSAGHVLSAFGQGLKEGWGADPLGIAPENVEYLRKLGLFNDYQKGHATLTKAFNEALIRPAAFGLDALLRGTTAAFRGAQGAVAQVGEEAGQPQLGRDVAAIPEAFFGSPHPLGNPKTLPDLPRARSLGVIGEGESGWKGTTTPNLEARFAAETEALKAQSEAVAQAAKERGQEGTPALEPAQTPGTEAQPDIHAVARRIAPETFQKFDDLSNRKQVFRRWIDELSETRDAKVAAEAPHGEEIADLQSRMEDATPRLQKKYQARLDEMMEERERYIEENTRGDSPDMTKIRQRLMQTDYAMRDLSPQVGDAYRRAQERLPQPAQAETPVGAPDQAQPEATEKPVQESGRLGATLMPKEEDAAQRATAESEARQAAPVEQLTREQQVQKIADDVAQKLAAAGRPSEEAKAAAALVASHYEARAARFGGAKGSALQLYNAEGPEIKAARAKQRAKELAQSQRLGKISIVSDARNIISLSAKADASTFLHETGHQWLEELMGDAADARAPADLTKDAQTVRQWLGAKEGEDITRAQHERFARGFETYMMEGRAPSTALARVFEQFRQWLTSIYQTVAKLRSPISDDIRDVFDRLIVAKPERVTIAPEREAPKSLADLHEADAESTPPHEAHIAAEQAQGELDRAAKEVLPEKENARLEGVAEEVRGGEEAGPQSNGDLNAPGPGTGKTGAREEPATLGEGDREAAPESTPARPERSEKVEKGPASKEPRHQTLLEFLSMIGGLKATDPLAGDLRSIFGGKNKFIPGYGQLIRKNGLSLDKAREAAVEAGYLVDEGIRSGGNASSTIDHLLQKIDEEARGNRVYREGEGPRTEIDADEHDKKIHYLEGEFETALNEIGMKPEDIDDATRARVIEILDREGETDPHTALERAWMEAGERGAEAGQTERIPDYIEGWDVPHEPGADAGASGADAQVGGPAHAPISENRGRTREGSGPAPDAANVPFERPETDLIDKAGNIRLDNLNTPEDINAILQQTAQENGDFMDVRGVVSDAQVLDLADAAGVAATELDMARFAEQFGKGGLASKVMKLRQMLVQSAGQVRDLAAKAAEGADTDLMEFAQSKARHQMIQSTLSAVTAEAGRALRAFHEIGGMKEAQAISEFLRDATGRDLFQIRREAQGILALDTPAQVSKFVHDSAKPTFPDMLLEYWINGLISGPATHTTYSVGNALLAMWKAVPESAAAAAVGTVRKALGGEGERVMFGEVPAQLYGMMRGAQTGIVAAWEAVKSGKTTMLPGELDNMTARQLQLSPMVNPRAAIPDFNVGGVPVPLGTVARIPSRGIAAIHSFFRAMNYEREMAGLAYRQASMEGLEGDAFARRIGEIQTNPTPELMQQSRASATDLTLMGKGGEITQALTKLTNARFAGGQWLKFIDPFVHISSNVIEQALVRRTVVGVFSHEVRADLSGVNGPIARDTAIARMAVGSGLAVAVGSLAAEGLVNGSGPSDPKERSIWTMVNGPPHSVKIGETWYDIHRLGPLGMQIGVAADLYEVAHMIGKDDATDIVGHLIHAFTQNVLDESFMRGPADLIKALHDPDRYGGSYVRNFLSSFTPMSVGMGQVARGIDPFSRQTRTMMDAVKAKVPWLSETMLPRRDIFGEPIPNKSALGVAGLSAIYETKVNNDPVPKAMLRLGVFPSLPQRQIRGIELTDQQYDDYSRFAGRYAKMRLDAIVHMPGFTSLPDGAQRDMLVGAISTSRETARSVILMQSPDIIHKAVANKVEYLKTGEKPY